MSSSAADEALLARFRRRYWEAFRALDTIRLRAWERSGLSLPLLRLLYAIRRRPGVTTGMLAAELGITVSTVSGLVSKLVDRGLVARTTAADDRRQQPLSLTDEGSRLTGELSAAGAAHLDEVARRLGPALPAVAEALEWLAEAAAAPLVPEAAAVPTTPDGSRPAGAEAGR